MQPDHPDHPDDPNQPNDPNHPNLEGRGRGLYARWLESPDLGEVELERRRLAAALRKLVVAVVDTSMTVDQIRRVTASVEREIRSVTESKETISYGGYRESALWGGDPHAQFELSPVIGRANPLAPPLDLWERDGEVHGRVRFSVAYEGPPGHVHGGYVAAVFDELLGAAQSLSESPGMTGTLTVRYRRPTPLEVELAMRGRISRVEGRKIFTVGELRAGDQICAEAEGIFVSIDVARFVEMLSRRRGRSVTG
ncbi:MAG: hypothetical protein KatS3mg008_0743 [Acidimicrobiales bacterium]|nr:MAG: hypothetical protein KatS3mg008_0743 [Acidimicrobiales bacterium]